jgi:hypothetical protein
MEAYRIDSQNNTICRAGPEGRVTNIPLNNYDNIVKEEYEVYVMILLKCTFTLNIGYNILYQLVQKRQRS